MMGSGRIKLWAREAQIIQLQRVVPYGSNSHCGGVAIYVLWLLTVEASVQCKSRRMLVPAGVCCALR